MIRRLILVCVGVAVLGGVLVGAGPEQWAQFRGPASGVVADDPALPDTWSAEQNVAWKTPIAGIGWSSPIVWDDHIFVTTVVSGEKPPVPGLDIIEDDKNASYKGGMRAPIARSPHKWVLVNLDFKTGKVRWQTELKTSEPLAAKHPKNSYASETPVTDGKRVYVYNGDLGLFAVDFKGELVWATRVMPLGSLPAEDPTRAAGRVDFGTASSPALNDDLVFVSDDHEPQEWFLAAYDTATGKQRWRVGDKKIRKGGAWLGWSSPVVWKNSVRTEVVVIAGGAVRSFDVSGNPLWQMHGLGTNSTATPVISDDMVFVGSGYPADSARPTWAIKAGAGGDITLKEGEAHNAFVLWTQPKLAAYIPSAIAYRDNLYTLHSQGFFHANNAKTGEPLYPRRRIDRATSGFSASPWAYNGKLFVLSEDGDTYVIQPGADYKVLAKNSLGELTLATPAILRGSLIFRTVSGVYRITDRSVAGTQ